MGRSEIFKNIHLKQFKIIPFVLTISFLFNCEFIEKITKSGDNDKCGADRTAEKKDESPAAGLPLPNPFTTYLDGDVRHFYFSLSVEHICPHEHIDIEFYVILKKQIENLSMEASVLYFVLYDRPITMTKVGNLTWKGTDNFGIKHAFGNNEGDIYSILDLSFPTRGDEMLDRNYLLLDIVHQCSIKIQYKKFKK